jgi:Tol biopolymer transport system component
MNRKRIFAPLLTVLILGMIFTVTATVPSGAPAGLDQTKPAAAVSEVIHLPPGWQLTRMPLGPFRTEIALAPDGRSLVFSASPDGSMDKAMLFRRPLDREEATVIPGTEEPCMPFFSPDGQWIGFWSKEKLNKVAVKGGVPSSICDLGTDTVGICWGSDGRIIFGREGSGLGYVSAAGGAPKTLTTLEAGKEATHRLPHLLPGGKALMFTVMPAQFGVEARIEWLSLETGKRKVVMEDGADARYVSTGHLIFVRRGTLMAAPFNLDRLETTGPAVTVNAGLMQAFNSSMTGLNSGAGQYSVSESGALISVSGGIFPDPVADLYWVDRGGRAEKWTEFSARPVMGIRLSPDGRQVAFSTHGLNSSMGLYDIQRKTVRRLTSGGQPWGVPVWTRDGNRVAFAWSKTGPAEIWWAAADGSGKLEQLRKTESEQRVNSWTEDGKSLAFVDAGDETGWDIRMLRIADRQVIPFAATKSNEVFPEFSPDGRWLAYASNESGRNEIYVRSFPDGKRTLPISTEGGTAPLWAPDGRELFYWNIDFTKMIKVDITPGQNLSAGTPKQLFEFAATGSSVGRIYDITPDGRRFLIREKKNYDLPPVTELNLVRNWFEELKRLSPAAK